MAFNKLTLEQKLLTKAAWQGACLIWIGQKDPRGYGRLRIGGKFKRAPRLLWELRNGPIPAGQVIRHKCDTPSCINIEHLELGTQLQNVRDCFERGRANRANGERVASAKLTAEQVSEIRRRYLPGKYRRGAGALAREFGVSKQSVQAILRGDSWK